MGGKMLKQRERQKRNKEAKPQKQGKKERKKERTPIPKEMFYLVVAFHFHLRYFL